MKKLEHLFKIIYLLQSGNMLTAKAIGDKVGISERNARAYVSTLMNGDIPIMSVNGRRGGYYLDKGYFLQVPALTEDEIIALGILRNMMDNPNKPQFSPEMVSAISKLILAGKKGKDNVENQPFQNLTKGITQDILKLVHLAITQKKKIQIVYQGIQEGTKNTRVICPYEIVFRDMAWYAYAFCELRSERRLFHISRVQEAKLLTEHFHMDDDEAFTHDMGKVFGLFRGAKEYEVNIYTCKVEGLDTIERCILLYGDMAQVIEPWELRERVRGILGRMMALYQINTDTSFTVYSQTLKMKTSCRINLI